MPYERDLKTAIFLAGKTKDPLLRSSIPILANLVAKELDDPEITPTFLEQNALNCVKTCEKAYFVLYGKHEFPIDTDSAPPAD